MNDASLLLDKTIHTLDGEIGSVDDLYFDDQTWNIRYLVIDTGKWLQERKVLVTPEAIVKPWHHQRAIAVKLTTEQVRSSPDLDTAMPMSRAAEELLHRHYQWTPYWDAATPVPPILPSEPPDGGSLRSANELAGYRVKAGDGEVGEVLDLLLDDDLSHILFLIVEVEGWFFGKKVLAGPSLISRMDFTTRAVYLNANRQALKSAQEYNPAA